jgi:hypothetical protein
MSVRDLVRPTVRIDEGLHEQLVQAQEDQWAVVVKPPEAAKIAPREAAEDIFRAIHPEVESVSFEIHHLPSGRIEFRTVTQSFDKAILLQNRILANVNGEVEIVRAGLSLSEGEAVAGARLEYDRDYILPLRTIKSHDDGVGDAYSHLFKTMTEETDARCVIQFVLSPVKYSRFYKWGYWLLQHWHEKIEETWTSRWSRVEPPTLATDRRPRGRSLKIASMLSFILYAVWIFVGQNPFTALPSIQLLDAVLPAALGPVEIPAHFSTPLFGPASPIDPLGQLTYVLMVVIVACLYLVAVFGYGLEPPERWMGVTLGDLARSKGTHEDRRPSPAEKRTAEAIVTQQRDLGYRVNARVLTIDEDAQRAASYRDSLVKQFETSWRNTATKQHLTSTTMGRFGHVHHRLPRFVRRVTRRESTRTRWFWIQKLLLQGQRRKPIYMAPFEVGALAHWPDASAGAAEAIAYTSEEHVEMPPGRGEFADEPEITGSSTSGALTSDGGTEPAPEEEHSASDSPASDGSPDGESDMEDDSGASSSDETPDDDSGDDSDDDSGDDSDDDSGDDSDDDSDDDYSNHRINYD